MTNRNPANTVRAHELLFDEGLKDFTDKMDGKSADFVEQTVERFERYGDDTFISDKQLEWLESLGEKLL